MDKISVEVSQTYFSRKILFFNVCLTILIVIAHSAPNLRFGIELTRDYPLIYTSIIFSQTAVSLFFFISGILFYRNVKEIKMVRSKMLRRVRSLLIPYLFWNIFFFLIIFFMTRMPFIGSHMNMGEIRGDFKTIIVGILDSRLTPLWFVKDLMIFTLLAPVIYLAIRNIYFAVITLAISVVNVYISHFEYTNWLLWLPIYLQGAILGMHWYVKEDRLLLKNKEAFFYSYEANIYRAFYNFSHSCMAGSYRWYARL